MKWMEKKEIEGILSGAGHTTKMNRYNRFMQTLPVSLELQVAYSPGGGGS